MVSLDTIRDPLIHSQRRKLWDQAFSIRGKHYLTRRRVVERAANTTS